MAKSKKRDEAAKSAGMSMEQRLENYRASGRVALTPRQIRRAAHKAKVATSEVG